MVEVKVMVDVAVTCGVGGPGFNPSSLLEYEVFGKKLKTYHLRIFLIIWC